MMKRVEFPLTIESLKIVAAQLACSWGLLVAIQAVSRALRTPLYIEFCTLGLLFGAMIYGHYREKKYPFTLGDNIHPLSIRVMLMETGVALLILWSYGVFKGWVSFPLEMANREKLFVLTGILLGSAGPMTYILTRFGMATSHNRLMQTRASR